MLPLEKCRGQAYDGASNMSGHIRRVAAGLKQEESAALHVHCLAHSLDLCLQDTVLPVYAHPLETVFTWSWSWYN